MTIIAAHGTGVLSEEDCTLNKARDKNASSSPGLRVRKRRQSRTFLLTCPLLWVTLLLVTTVVVNGRKTQLTWINGIAYNLEHMKEGQLEISTLFDAPCLYCHNPTGMAHEDDVLGYLTDLTQATAQKLGHITSEVSSLVQHLKDAVQTVGKKGVVIHIAHSQGALITSLACKKLSTEEMQQMEVLTFGGAAALRQTPQTPFRRCINYYSVNDPLLFVVPEAVQALRSGYVVGGHEHSEFCFLAPRVGDPLVDHMLLGPTYLQALQWEAERFQREHYSAVYRFLKPYYVMAVALVQAFLLRVHAIIKAILKPILLWALLIWMCLRHQAKKLKAFVLGRFVHPLLLLWSVFALWFQRDILRREEEYFVPVPTSMMPSSKDASSSSSPSLDGNIQPTSRAAAAVDVSMYM